MSLCLPRTSFNLETFHKMFFNFAFITLSLFCAFSQTSAIQARELLQRDLVQDVVRVLELLHASSFCSSFAPQPTVVVTGTTKANNSILHQDTQIHLDTVVTSQTTTTSATSTAVTVVCKLTDYKGHDSKKPIGIGYCFYYCYGVRYRDCHCRCYPNDRSD